ncbi:MAG: alpha/beta hydrolase [Pseudomonadota bacterium]
MSIPSRAAWLTLTVVALVAGVARAAPTDDWLAACRLDQVTLARSVPARCGRLAVPENRDDPASREIELAVALVPSLNIDPLPDPLVLIAGGPGQSTIEFYLGYQGAFEAVRLNREILLIDQRGTGASNPLVCPDVEAQFEDSSDLDVIARAAELCIAALDGDPRYFTTSVAVRDLDAVREALGYESLNIYGVSYGTRVAQHYARRFPDRLRRMILDGVAYPGLILGPAIAIDAQNALDQMFARCAADSRCSDRFPNLADDFTTLRTQLADEPATVVLPDPRTGSQTEQLLGTAEFGAAMRLLSYSPTTVALMPLLIDEALHNDNLQPLAAQFAMIERQLVSTLNIGMHYAVVCSEDAPFYGEVGDIVQTLSETYLGQQSYDAMAAVCTAWPAGPIDADFREPLAVDTPTLLLSGENDPVTPPIYAEKATEGLSQHQHVVGPAYGHGLAPHGCVPRLMARFLEAEEPLPVDAACVDDLAVMPFFVDFSGPAE